jgi:hypothetical protein
LGASYFIAMAKEILEAYQERSHVIDFDQETQITFDGFWVTIKMYDYKKGIFIRHQISKSAFHLINSSIVSFSRKNMIVDNPQDL